MATYNPSSVPQSCPQYNSMQGDQALGGLDHELGSNGHLPGTNHSAGPYPAMNYVNAPPPTRYASYMGYDDPPHLATGPAEQQGNSNQLQFDGHRTPGGIIQYIPIAPGPAGLEQLAPAIPEVPNDCPRSPLPLTYNVAGPSRGNPSLKYSGMPVADDLKSLAGHYLHNPGSRIDRLRMKRSRSGAVKVLILLETDDTM